MGRKLRFLLSKHRPYAIFINNSLWGMSMKSNFSQFKKTAMVSALLLELTAVQAATINVDGTTCTLADAITAANTDVATGGCAAGVGDDVLELDSAGSPFTQTTALPVFTSNITINGNDSVVARDLASPDFPVIYIDGGNATLNDLTITGGSATNTATNFGAGVVVRAGSAVEINNSIISGNNGGAVWIYNTPGSTINNSVIENNTSNPGAYYTGGVSINSGYLDINNSTITGNSNVATTAGGGGLYVTDYSGATTVGVTNSTISGNTSVVSGGGIHSIGFGVNGIELNLNNVTVTLNDSSGGGGGMYNTATDVAVSQSLLSGNTAGSASSQWEASGSAYVTVDSYNIFGSSSTSGLVGVTPGVNDIIPTATLTDILDLTLTDNGGPTPTHALVQSGPAVDVIPSCLLATDQTGKSRPIDGDADGTADCDVGAFENENPDVIFKTGFD